MELRKIRIRRATAWDDYRSDVLRIQQAFADAGYDISELEAHALWREYSEDVCAGWLFLPDNDADIVACLRGKFETVEDE